MDWQSIERWRGERGILAICDAARGYRAFAKFNGMEWEEVGRDGTPLRIGFYPTHYADLGLPDPPQPKEPAE